MRLIGLTVLLIIINIGLISIVETVKATTRQDAAISILVCGFSLVAAKILCDELK